eukprot:TRINITY_DN18337_c0_g1_i1.p1 TRINITY_DN18337_c0_g1~~TRINITY_DN18337_c0_g1_i1.p1  ORF type:complete len:169 (-),score=24.63 TRINITY_DN18337_c0_g1_i1:49-507(-)
MGSSFLGTAIRKPAFSEDEGLASISDLEAGFSGNAPYFFSKSSLSFKRNGSYKAFSSQGSARLYDARIEEPPYFLDACFLCKKPLGVNKDIFMYRGDTPFCSEACRQEQIDIDEAKEKNWCLSIKVASRKEQKKSPTKKQNLHARTGTVVAG